jgi:hypothetical protein
MNNTKIRNKKEIGESILRGLNEVKDNSESLRAIQNYEFRNQNEKQKDIPAKFTKRCPRIERANRKRFRRIRLI